MRLYMRRTTITGLMFHQSGTDVAHLLTAFFAPGLDNSADQVGKRSKISCNTAVGQRLKHNHTHESSRFFTTFAVAAVANDRCSTEYAAGVPAICSLRNAAETGSFAPPCKFNGI